MRQTFLFLAAAVAVLVLGACHSEPQWADPEEHERTEELNALYKEKVAGDWYMFRQKDTRRLYETLKLKADGRFEATMRYATRDTVQVNGEEVVTDWKTFINDTISGEWELQWSRARKENVIDLFAKEVSGPYAFHFQAVTFHGVTESELQINDLLFQQRLTFRRGTIDAPF